MPKILITFQEEGKPPISVEVNEATSAVLDHFVAEQTASAADGSATNKYSGKADLFMKHMLNTLIAPLVERYADIHAAEIKQQMAQIELQKKKLEMQMQSKFLPQLILPTAPISPAVNDTAVESETPTTSADNDTAVD